MLALIRYSCRVWRRTPVVSAAIIVTMAIAIGANTGSFRVLRAGRLDPLPYPLIAWRSLWTDATLLAVLGIFSLLHYATALRTREFGVRFALGATRSNGLALVVWDGVMLASIGALAGAAAAVAAGRAFSSLLFGVQPWDVETLVIVGLGAIGLAAPASVAPAVRAAMVNPAEALRAEWETRSLPVNR